MQSFMKAWLNKSSKSSVPTTSHSSDVDVESVTSPSIPCTSSFHLTQEVESNPNVSDEDVARNKTDTTDSENENKPQKKIKIKNRKRYEQKFRQSWAEHFDFLEERNDKCFCKVCGIRISRKAYNIKRHGISSLHLKNYRAATKTPKIKETLTKSEPIEIAIKRAEVILTSFICEHNLSFSVMNHLPLMCVNAFPDSKIAKQILMKRKKATQLAVNVLGPAGQKEIVTHIKQNPFSIIIDETTDVSLKKCLAVVVRYYKNYEIRDSFFELIEIEHANADSLYLSIRNLFDKHEIPYKNLVGMAADNASVMLGQFHSVQTLLRENLNSDIVIIGCTCHSFNLCTSHASKKLPEFLEKFVHDVCNYFSHSTKRTQDLKTFQEFLNEDPKKILKLCKTRWLSLQQVIDRILEHWNSLTLFFKGEYLVDKVLSAEAILNNFNNKIVKCYFLFLSFILNIINKLNLEFQSESPKLPFLLEKISTLYKTILKCFIKKTVLDKSTNLNNIIVSDPSNFLDLDSMYFGAKCDIYFKDIEKHVDRGELITFKRRALDFFIELCKQIKNRFNFDNEILQFASNFQPRNATSSNVLSIAQYTKIFSDLGEIDLEEVNLEWQMISEVEKQYLDCDFLHFWRKIQLQKNSLDQPMFSNLIPVIHKIMVLPHSSAAAERIFSNLNLIKVKNRNRLLIKTISAILHIKELLKKTNCFSFEPNKFLIGFNKSTLDTDVFEDDIIFE